MTHIIIEKLHLMLLALIGPKCRVSVDFMSDGVRVLLINGLDEALAVSKPYDEVNKAAREAFTIFLADTLSVRPTLLTNPEHFNMVAGLFEELSPWNRTPSEIMANLEATPHERQLIFDKAIVAAIKSVQDRTNLGLRDSKVLVEKWQSDIRNNV